MNKIKVFILLLPFMAICSWALYYANFVKNAPEVVLPITGYDPLNLLSGHYIEFRIDWKRANCHQSDWNGSCPISEFAKTTRFYVPENRAQELERIINNNRYKAEVVFAYEKGSDPVPKELLIDGKSWHNR